MAKKTKKIEAKKNKVIKKARKEAVKQKRHKWVHWTCKTCLKVIDIMISPQNTELYTKKREKKFICLNCQPIKKRK